MYLPSSLPTFNAIVESSKELVSNLLHRGERSGEWIVREFGMGMYTLLYLKWITNKDLLHSRGNSANVMRQPGWERSLGENGYMHMMVESLCYAPETITTLFIGNTTI